MSCTKKSSREVTINTALPHRSHNGSILSLHINNFPSLPKATQFLTILMTYLTFQDSLLPLGILKTLAVSYKELLRYIELLEWCE